MRSTTAPLTNRAVGARIRAEVEGTKPDSETGEAMKEISVTDPETGLTVLVKIPVALLASDPQAAAVEAAEEAARALRRAAPHHRAASVRELETRIMNQVRGKR